MIIILIYWYEIYGRFQSKFSEALKIKTCGKTVGILNTTVDLLCNIVITLPALFSKKKLEVEIENELKDMDTILSKYLPEVRRKRNKSLLVYLIILNIFYMILALNDASILFDVQGDTNYQFYVFDLFFRHRITMCGIYIYDLIKSCLCRIYMTNNILKVSFKNAHNESLMEDSTTSSILEELIGDISVLYSKFCSMVSSVNAIFGWPMLFIFFNYISLFITTYEMGLRISANLSAGISLQYVFWAGFSMAYSVVRLQLKT